jgi:hypothetical protein
MVLLYYVCIPEIIDATIDEAVSSCHLEVCFSLFPVLAYGTIPPISIIFKDIAVIPREIE